MTLQPAKMISLGMKCHPRLWSSPTVATHLLLGEGSSLPQSQEATLNHHQCFQNKRPVQTISLSLPATTDLPISMVTTTPAGMIKKKLIGDFN